MTVIPLPLDDETLNELRNIDSQIIMAERDEFDGVKVAELLMLRQDMLALAIFKRLAAIEDVRKD